MLTQVLFVHLVRTEKKPLIESRADVRLTVLGLIAAVLALLIPEGVVGEALGFAVLPGSFLVLLPWIVAGYAICVLAQRRRYIARFGRLL